MTPPRVALETTIITHGLPRPHNVETALHCEEIIRMHKAEPVTIGIIDGEPYAGLSRAQIEYLASAPNVLKTNLSNLSVALTRGSDGATSVSTTLLFARRAGVPVAATGGIGGVHRDYQRSHDVSSDLVALQEYPIVLVCSGAKSILDVAATREELETRGVPVIGWQTDAFPLFYSKGRDVPVDLRVETGAEVARFAAQHWRFRESGILVVVDPPADVALDHDQHEAWVNESLAAAEREGVTGRDLTPYILADLAQRSNGATLEANLGLIRNNCSVAAQIAVALVERLL